MKWLEKMNKSINYIEENLTSEVDYEKVARLSCCSVYHFQRMFSYIVDVPLSEYIRRRRLTLAAFELQNSDIKVIDLALKFGYESPDSFSRAFKNLHGVTPTLARDMGIQLKAYPRLSFHISIKGDVEMNYRVVEREGFDVFGKSITIGLNENPYEIIPKFWQDFQEDGTYQKICEKAGIEPYNGILLNAALYDFDNDGTYRNKYMIYTSVPQGKEIPEDFDTIRIPSAKWAVFSDTYDSPEDTSNLIQKLWKRIFSEWFPTSEYELEKGPQLEVYTEKDNKVEVWIPIKKR
ncbi:AraC family transcriptional regulator [Clostridium sp. D2Q-11]|uniref:AraC family transcriptional regulator n=1 Tax=Anaeromonas frigoriresistens TaxID=2683708 RepID=A0A942UQU3_9FIRM|nr:AraC family transcriptional regulator [Anaeromonas frigoriresistens]MBS4537513.1 AraC family transcriptional regulator [Anaeromonas frigoriresistens]